jgi:1,4-alpha-glucan branching enzyme
VNIADTDIAPSWHLDREAAVPLTQARSPDPFAVLGRHPIPDGWVIRAFVPGAKGVDVLDKHSGTALCKLSLGTVDGLFEGRVADDRPYILRIRWPTTVQDIEDPYAFALLLGDLDLRLFNEGRHSHWRIRSARSLPLWRA